MLSSSEMMMPNANQFSEEQAGVHRHKLGDPLVGLSVAVLITCFNRKSKTIKCLEKLYSQDIGDEYTLKVFLVDDASTDGTGEAIKTNFPQVNLIHGDGSLFWNRGMSLAWSTAGYQGFDYYLWLNDDVELFDNALPKLLGIYEAASIAKPFILIGSTCDPVSGQVTYGGAKR